MHELIAYLCGCFAADGNYDEARLRSLGWQRESVSEQEVADQKRVFYSEFVDFCFADTPGRGCTVWHRQVGEEAALQREGRSVYYRVGDVSLYLMPFGLVMYSVEVTMKAYDPDDFTAVLFSLRNTGRYDRQVHSCFLTSVVDPLLSAYELLTGRKPEGGIDSLIELGNKFKIFQVINSDMRPSELTQDERDLMLYQLATVSKVGAVAADDDFSVADSYLQRILDENRVAVFRNWDALALMDTFTIHAFRAQPWMLQNWQKSYFRMIYLHALFQKFYLQNLNRRFRDTLGGSKSSRKRGIGALNDEFEDFDRRCCFHRISYNFLPLEIVKAMANGLDTDEERRLLHEHIERERHRKEAQNEKLVNTLLFCLSMLTFFSAIWDFSCLLDQMYPFADNIGNQMVGYRTVALFSLLLLAGLVVALWRKRSR